MTVEMIHSRHRATPAVRAVREAIEGVLERKEDGCARGSLTDLAAATGATTSDVSSALRLLEPIDHAITVDVLMAREDDTFVLSWAPVTEIVHLMIDWDLLDLDISLAELEHVLEVNRTVLLRALTWMTSLPGTEVQIDGRRGFARVVLSDDCPLLTGATW